MDWKKQVVYQIYPRSFQDSNNDGVGDIQGIIQRLDYLQDLGVGVLWLSPIYKSPDKDNGYDISDYYDISEKFGTLEDFKQLLAEAHKRDMRILMDLVVNHTSDQHKWFQESRASKDSPKWDYYIWRDGFEGKAPATQYGYFMESVWTYDEIAGQYYFHNFAVEQPELNWENEELRHEIYKMMRYWLDMGVDGFRMDVINLISKPEAALRNDGGSGAPTENGPRVHEFLQEMRRESLSKYNTITVGETPGVSPEDAAQYANPEGTELDMVFQFELVGAADTLGLSKWHTQKVSLADFKHITERWQKGLHNRAWNSLYLSNHDQPRQVSRFGDTGTALFWEKSAKMLATVMHMQQGTPYVYQGEELGMTNYQINSLDDCRDYEVFSSHKDMVVDKKLLTESEFIAGLNERCRDHARTPVQWNTRKNAGFSEGEPWIPVNPNYVNINAEAQLQDKNSIHNYYKKLIALRKEVDCITDGDFTLLLREDPNLMAYSRKNTDTELLLVANFSNATQKNPLDMQGEVLIANYEAGNLGELRPYEVIVMRRKIA